MIIHSNTNNNNDNNNNTNNNNNDNNNKINNSIILIIVYAHGEALQPRGEVGVRHDRASLRGQTLVSDKLSSSCCLNTLSTLLE